MGAVRQYLYAPDGRPPAGWPASRDAALAKRILRRVPNAGEVCDAIEGIRLAVDAGEFTDWTPPVRPRDKLTLRILYRTRSGHLPTWTIALNTLATRWKASGPRKPSRPLAIDAMLGGGGHGATD